MRSLLATAAAATAMIGVSIGTADAQSLGVGHCYWRADAGFGWSASSSASGQSAITGIGTAAGNIGRANLDNNWLLDAGLGCRLVWWAPSGGSIKDVGPGYTAMPSPFRGDVTFGYLGARRFTGVAPTPPGALEGFVQARLRGEVVMFNAYYDMPTAFGWTPYLGAGIGVANQVLHRVQFGNNGVVIDGTGNDEKSFAWALMAGAAVDLGAGVMFDIGYRYLGLDGIRAVSPNGNRLSIADGSEHQLRFGFRVPIANYFD